MSGHVLDIVLFFQKALNFCGIPMELPLSCGINRYNVRERKS